MSFPYADSSSATWRNNLTTAAIIMVALLLTYWTSLSGEFVVDDKVWAALPKSKDPLGNISSVFTSWGFSWTSLQVKGPPQFRPLGTLILMIAHDLFGPNPVAFHLFSISCHFLNCLLIFKLLGLLLPDLQLTFRLLPVLAFALHPALTEAVAWITSINELQMTTCVLLAMISYLQWRNSNRRSWLLAALAFALAGMLIKEAALAFILLVLAFDWCRDRKIQWPAFFLLGAVTLFYFVWRLWVIGAVAGKKQLTYSVMKVAEILAAHLRYLFIPGQQPFSIDPAEAPLTGPFPLVLTGLLLAALCWWGWRQAPNIRNMLCFGGSWIVISLWPAYAIALIGTGYFAGRHIYLPAVGWVLLLGLVLNAALAKLPWLKYAVAGGVIVMAVATARATQDWHSSIAVYRQATKLSPNYEGALAGLANALLEAGYKDQALASYEQLLARTTSKESRGTYLYQLALVCSETGRLEESNRHLEQLLQEAPDHASAWVGLGNNAWLAGHGEVALRHYKRALELDPGNFEAQRNSSVLVINLGKNPLR